MFVVLHGIGGFSYATCFLTLVLATAAIGGAHAALYRARAGSKPPPYAGAAYVSPQAQWRARRPTYNALKRSLDIALASAGIVVLSPIALLVAICVALQSGFPIIFRQERVGRGGAPFTIYKFRTMRSDAGSNWVRAGDRRITRLGAFLRRSSLDEIPQLFNVLRGDMSLVGPRPEMVEFASEFTKTIPNYNDRHIVVPGITGWAQTHAKRNLDPSDMPDVVPYDLFYVENASLLLDVIIIIKTAIELPFHRAV
jgi:lipopolysaccharide/colanic/teichoic acid biosynthesis glycosyltransferase